MKKQIMLIIIFTVIGLLSGFFIGSFSTKVRDQAQQPVITAQTINEFPYEYSYTTAICNGENRCIDVLVECKDGNVISLTPTSNFVQLSPDFKDSRHKNEKFCE